jgi:hypothetical protein
LEGDIINELLPEHILIKSKDIRQFANANKRVEILVDLIAKSLDNEAEKEDYLTR